MEVEKISVPNECKFDARLVSWGVFDGLVGFMTESEWLSVCETGKLTNGKWVGLPMTLPVAESLAKSVEPGQQVELIDENGMPFATFKVGGTFIIDPVHELRTALGTSDESHPWFVKMRGWGCHRLSGEVVDFYGDLGADPFKRWLSPSETRGLFAKNMWTNVAAFQTRNPLHGAHLDLLQEALNGAIDGVWLNPAMGITKKGDLSPSVRARCYEAALSLLPKARSAMSYAPLAMRMAGPREAIWHALIRKAFGATKFIVGRDHAGPGLRMDGAPFYAQEAARELALSLSTELGIGILAFDESVYSIKRNRYISVGKLDADEPVATLSGTKMREMLAHGDALPEWFSPPEVSRELATNNSSGFCIFLTGLSASGKSALATRLAERREMRERKAITILDGDEARKMLSSELGFSRQHRDLNIQRLSYVAGEISKHGGAAVIAAIAPYDQARNEGIIRMRKMGTVCLVHVNTSLEVCERRDSKGLYKKARAGLLPNFTGIDDPYEKPSRADLVLDMGNMTLDEGCEEIEAWLTKNMG